MKKTKIFALVAVVFMLSLSLISPVMGQKKSSAKKGGGASLGVKIFQKECTACHPGGTNTIESEKTLKADAFKKFGFNSVADVKKRIENGAGVMPIYKDTLKPAEIEAVANYVWTTSQKNGWPK